MREHCVFHCLYNHHHHHVGYKMALSTAGVQGFDKCHLCLTFINVKCVLNVLLIRRSKAYWRCYFWWSVISFCVLYSVLTNQLKSTKRWEACFCQKLHLLPFSLYLSKERCSLHNWWAKPLLLQFLLTKIQRPKLLRQKIVMAVHVPSSRVII